MCIPKNKRWLTNCKLQLLSVAVVMEMGGLTLLIRFAFTRGFYLIHIFAGVDILPTSDTVFTSFGVVFNFFYDL